MLIHLYVKGRVQGVGFRSFVRKQAMAHELSGWVRNRSDGSVELMLDGQPANIELFMERCRRGSYFSRVKSLEPVAVPNAPIMPIESGVCTILPTV